RQKYYAVIDRSNLSLDPTDPTFRKQGPAPFITELVNPVAATDTAVAIRAQGGVAGAGGYLQLNYEGQAFLINAGFFLRLSTGDGTEWVQVTAVTGYDPATGTGALTVTRNTKPGGAAN